MFKEVYTESKPNCGEIWMCHLAEKNGSVQGGYRPVFVLSNDKNNTYSPTLNIIPITSKMNKRALPVHVELWHYKKYGLKEPSTMMIEQIMTVNSDCLDRKVGRVSDNKTLMDIKRAMSIQFPVLCVS